MLHEEVKEFQRVIQEIVLVEFSTKMHVSIPLLEENSS